MKTLKLIASLIISFSAAALGSLATVSNIPTWYAHLSKPFFNPPNWVFGPVWSVLYTLIGISLFLVWTTKTKRSRTLAYQVFGVQMVLNAAWSLVFFGWHKEWLGLVVIIGLILATLYNIKLFRPISSLASRLLMPYPAWICFAACLNAGIALLN